MLDDSSASSATSNGDSPQLNGYSAPSLPLLTALWNPFGGLLALNPSLLSPSASTSLPSPSSSSPTSFPSPFPHLSSSSAVDFASASAIPQLIHRLCSLLSQGIPSLLRLAHLIATRQLTGGPSSVNPRPAASPNAASASATPQGSLSSPSAATSPSPPLPLQGVSAEHRRAIQVLLDGAFHHFSAYVRLALFPVTAEEVKRWEAAGPVRENTEVDGAARHGTHPSTSSPPSSAVLSPLKGGPSSSSSTVFSVERWVDKSTEHGPFSFEESPSPSSHLPLLDPPPVPSPLALPSSTQQTIHLLLRTHQQMAELGLSADSLRHLHHLRQALVRWFVDRTVAHTKAAIEQLQGEETWELLDDKTQGRGGRRGRSTSSPSSFSSSRRTALPSRFHSLMRAALTSLAAIPSIKANWIIQAITGPVLDCMAAFALAIERSTRRALEEEEDRGEKEAQGEVEEEDDRGRPVRRGGPQSSGGGAVAEPSLAPRPRLSLLLLLSLSNLRFARSVVLPSVLSDLLALFPSSTHSVVTDAFTRSVLPQFDALDEALLQRFLRLHLLTLHRRVRDEAYNPSALLSHLHTRVEGGGGRAESRSLRVRGVVVDLLLDLVHIHSDLFFLCPALIPPACQHLTAGIVQSIQFCAQHCSETAGQTREDGEEEKRRAEGVDEEEAEEAAAVSASAKFWGGRPELVDLALLEVAFLARTLEAFATSDSTAAVQSIRAFLTQATLPRNQRKAQQRESEWSEGGMSDDRREQLLTVEVKATAAMFHCFTATPPPQTQQRGRKGKKGGRGREAGEGEETEVEGDSDGAEEDGIDDEDEEVEEEEDELRQDG